MLDTFNFRHNYELNLICCIMSKIFMFHLCFYAFFIAFLNLNTLMSFVGKSMETYEVAVSEFGATSSSLSSSTDVKSIQHEIENTKLSSFISDSATINSGISDTMKLLRTLGEGYRHLCMFRCKVLLRQLKHVLS